MTSGDDIKAQSDLACEAGEKFVKLFYESFDKRRHVLKNCYLDAASLNWNGNVIAGPADIVKYIENLPSSEHVIESLDAQPVSNLVTNGQITILVSVGGTVKYHENKIKAFTQNFVLTSQNNTWKIVSDNLRTVE